MKLMTFTFLLMTSHAAWAQPARYLVPLGDGTTASYASGDARIESAEGGTRVLSFKLPDDLVGSSGDSITLAQSGEADGFTRFSNARVTASCRISSRTICVMSYGPDYGQELDRASIDRFLNAKYAGDATGLARALEQSRDFQRDPEGVLIF